MPQCRFITQSILLLFLCLPIANQAAIKQDEQLQFFTTDAYIKENDPRRWVVPIHGWIYEREEKSIWRKVFISSLGKLLGLSTQALQDNPYFRERIRLFLVDNERGKRISIQLGKRHYRLQRSQPNGHFSTQLTIKSPTLAAFQQDGWLHFQAITRTGDVRTFHGAIRLLAPKGISIISDIDDTIKHSQVLDHTELLRNSFLRAYKPIIGMPQLYDNWAKQGANFHYISSSPWQLYPFLADFLVKQGFPRGSIQLRLFRFKDTSGLRFLDLLGKDNSMQYKLSHIQSLLTHYPQRHFLLVGDSGEKDPEVYAEITRRYPQQVKKILIRAVDGADNRPARFRTIFSGLPASLWMLFTDPAQLKNGIVRNMHRIN